jgi:hypothetical protein
MSDLPYIVSVHGTFTDEGFWFIDARLHWPQGPPAIGTENLGKGLMALLKAIADEGQRGRSLGATKVQVHIEGHDRHASPLDSPSDGGTTH